MEEKADVFTVREKVRKESPSVSKRKKRTQKRKPKTDEPVSETNIDSWFYKNFGKLFNDGEDQPMDE